MMAVIPEIVAALAFGAVSRTVFGEGNPSAPLYFVMLGGVCLLVAAACVAFVRDVGAGAAVHAAIPPDAEPALVPQPSAQPVPSDGLGGG